METNMRMNSKTKLNFKNFIVEFSSTTFRHNFKCYMDSTSGAQDTVKQIQKTFLVLCLRKIDKDTKQITSVFEKAKLDRNKEQLDYLLPWSNQDWICSLN